MMRVLLADDRYLFCELHAAVLQQNTHLKENVQWSRSPRLANS
jgi:hypothetical protein